MTGRMESPDSGQDDEGPLEKGTSTIEWIAAACGGAVFIAMIGYMTYAGFKEVQGSPKVELRAGQPVRQGNRFLLGFTATNVGEATATSLTVRATLTDEDKEIESQEATIDYLPMQSSRAGGFFFEHDPADYKLTIGATSYLDP
jgi:uncharacterized protein (TIGR02588 family)